MPNPERTKVTTTADPVVMREVDPADPSLSHGYAKPSGFWYQVDRDWERWCVGEHFRVDMLAHRHIVELADCNMLYMRTVEDLDRFTAEYVTVPLYPGASPFSVLPDWAALGQLYDGVEIAPYVWERRLEHLWYYGWDCASGVIWRPRNAFTTYLGPIVPASLRIETYEEEEALA